MKLLFFFCSFSASYEKLKKKCNFSFQIILMDLCFSFSSNNINIYFSTIYMYTRERERERGREKIHFLLHDLNYNSSDFFFSIIVFFCLKNNWIFSLTYISTAANYMLYDCKLLSQYFFPKNYLLFIRCCCKVNRILILLLMWLIKQYIYIYIYECM